MGTRTVLERARAFLLLLPVAACFQLSSTERAAAQTSPTEANPKWRERCQAAGSVAASTRHDPEFILALHELRNCELSGAIALAAVWRAHPTDNSVLSSLVASSQQIHDRRLLDAVLGVAADEASPTKTRMAALNALATYVYGSPTRLKEIDDETAFEPFAFASALHWTPPRIGPQPFPVDHQQLILNELARIAAATTDEKVGLAAGYLVQRLGRRIGR